MRHWDNIVTPRWRGSTLIRSHLFVPESVPGKILWKLAPHQPPVPSCLASISSKRLGTFPVPTTLQISDPFCDLAGLVQLKRWNALTRHPTNEVRVALRPLPYWVHRGFFPKSRERTMPWDFAGE